MAAKLYPGGFTINTEVIGSVYGYTNGLPVLGLAGGQLSLTNGNLTQSITNDPTTNKLTFRTLSGLFKGNVMNPETGKLISRSEEHTSELQSLRHLVCRLLLEKK